MAIKRLLIVYRARKPQLWVAAVFHFLFSEQARPVDCLGRAHVRRHCVQEGLEITVSLKLAATHILSQLERCIQQLLVRRRLSGVAEL